MFLAWNELKSAKLRYLLIIGVLTLMSYMVFLLSGLADGLQQMNREAIDTWHADAIVLSKDSDLSLPQSSLTVQEALKIHAAHRAELAQLSAVVRKKGNSSKESTALLGIRRNQFLRPAITEGRMFKKNNEVVADDDLKDAGYRIGDKLAISSSGQKLVITGFTAHAKLNAAPVLYTTLETVQKIKFGNSESGISSGINGVILRDPNYKKLSVPGKLKISPIESLIRNLPGYMPESISLNFMIYFLFIIAAVTIGIFLYVLTIQKLTIFGVLKVQGLSSFYLIRSVFAQTFLLAAFGVLAGLALTGLTGVLLPAAVPIHLDVFSLLLYGLIFIAAATIGSIFSVSTIVKIDPAQAIGG